MPLHILEKHGGWNDYKKPKKRALRQHILFANATMHPAYGRLFFLLSEMDDSVEKEKILEKAAQNVSSLWQVVEDKLAKQAFLLGDEHSAADVLLAVYSNWNAYFPVDIQIGSLTQKMINKVKSLPSYKRALEMEGALA